MPKSLTWFVCANNNFSIQIRLRFFVTNFFFSLSELVYCGSVLDDSVKLSDEDIKSGSTIHVFEKNEKQETEPTPLTEDSIQDASTAYRSVCFSSPPSYPFPVS